MQFIIHGPKPSQPIPTESLGRQIYNGLLKNQHLPEVLVDAASGESLSYKRLLVETYELAQNLQRLGIVQNSVISICSENNMYFFHPVLAAMYLGAIVAPLNHNYTSYELLHAANITKPQTIFCSKAVLDKVLDLKNSVKYTKLIVVLDADKKGNEYEILKNFTRIDSNFKTEKAFEPIDVNPKEQVALLLCSSGTTGLPKAVMLTQRNIQISLQQRKDPRFIIQYEPGTTLLGVLPFFHTYGFMVMLGAITAGHKVAFLAKFEERLFLETIQNYKCRNLLLAPPLLIFLAKSPLVDQYDLSSVEDIISGAAPLSKATEEAVKQRLNIPSIRQGYGMTELTIAVLVMPVKCKNKPGSSGVVLPHTSAKVRHIETHELLGPHQVGELCFKGELVMKGYVGNEKASKDMIDNDGYLCTGDVGYYDEEGYFYIVDRIKELIKYKGFQVAPAELEALLLTHPAIQDAAVIGRPDVTAGELPLAFVVKESFKQLTEKDVQDFVAKYVSHQKHLRGGVMFVEKIPKNPSGKLLRRELRELLQAQKSKL